MLWNDFILPLPQEGCIFLELDFKKIPQIETLIFLLFS